MSFLPLIYTANITIASGVPFNLLNDVEFDLPVHACSVPGF